MEIIRLTVTQHSKPGDLGDFSYSFLTPSGAKMADYDFSTETAAEQYGKSALRSIYKDASVEIEYKTAF